MKNKNCFSNLYFLKPATEWILKKSFEGFVYTAHTLFSNFRRTQSAERCSSAAHSYTGGAPRVLFAFLGDSSFDQTYKERY